MVHQVGHLPKRDEFFFFPAAGVNVFASNHEAVMIPTSGITAIFL